MLRIVVYPCNSLIVLIDYQIEIVLPYFLGVWIKFNL